MQIETVPIDSLREHPRNYRLHPDAQVVEIAHSLNQFGQYKPVVVSSDGVILAGHGVWTAQKAQGATDIATVRMEFPHTDPRAEKLMVADNELSRMAVDDDAALAALLQDVSENDNLAGTGFDDDALNALLGDIDGAAFGGSDDDHETLETLSAKWLVAFVVDEQTKRAIDDLVAAEALPGEHPSATCARILTAQVVKKT